MIPLGDYKYYMDMLTKTNGVTLTTNHCYFSYNIPGNTNQYLFAVPTPIHYLGYWLPNSEETFKYGFMDPKEKKVFSQDGTDGVLEFIFSDDVLKTTNKCYVELGTGDGSECNSKNLRVNHGWTGLMIDGAYENTEINLQKHFITKENILQLFEKYKINKNLDLLSIDLDGNDFYILNEILKNYSPRVIVAEYTGPGDRTIEYDPEFAWDHKSDWMGMGFSTLYKLGRHHGYSLVYSAGFGVNAFFIRDDELTENIKKCFKFINEPDNIYKRAKYGVVNHIGHPPDPKNRKLITFNEAILKQ
jgi:hypothetical protein